MTNSQAERLIAVLERIAMVLEGPTAEERLAADYARSRDLIRDKDLHITVPVRLTTRPGRLDDDRPRS